MADPEELPSILDLVVREPSGPSAAASPGLALVLCSIGVVMFLALAAISVTGRHAAEPRPCIHPIHDFGTDSPALRLFLMQQDPDICFQYRWSPRVEEMLEAPEPALEQPY